MCGVVSCQGEFVTIAKDKNLYHSISWPTWTSENGFKTIAQTIQYIFRFALIVIFGFPHYWALISLSISVGVAKLVRAGKISISQVEWYFVCGKQGREVAIEKLQSLCMVAVCMPSGEKDHQRRFSKVHSMDFGRVSSQLDRAITSWELFQRLSATQRKVMSLEDNDLCFFSYFTIKYGVYEKLYCISGLLHIIKRFICPPQGIVVSINQSTLGR